MFWLLFLETPRQGVQHGDVVQDFPIRATYWVICASLHFFASISPLFFFFLQASESQPAQFKKKANKEYVKDVSKKINKSTPAFGLTENNEMNIKKWVRGETDCIV